MPSFSYFEQSSVADNTVVLSHVSRANIASFVATQYSDPYFGDPSKISQVRVYYVHSDFRQNKRLVFDGDTAEVSWTSNAKDGTWYKHLIRLFDFDGAVRDIPQSDIPASEHLTHSGGFTVLNLVE